ncbi:37S ribosomal S22, mitochondrial [Lecanosticta acicola]|uniref:37S ribosomal S22, mitochondrial n=1 Tax=Lecanosticta acicola TaxID=111012 RepID=A0AAI8YRP4_9PEZI|nr:37S ribosomal S22, mitochondrial [Lecanosticta acicola]
MILGKQLARAGRVTATKAVSRGGGGGGGGGGIPWQRNASTKTGSPRPPTKDPHGRKQAQEKSNFNEPSHLAGVGVFEDLYKSGNLEAGEWRKVIDEMCSLRKQPGEGREGEDGLVLVKGKKPEEEGANYQLGVEERVRRIRDFFGGGAVPGVVLGEEERRVHERLFGDVRVLERVMEEGEGEVGWIDEEEGDSGTGLLRQDGEGGLEEVEFEVEEGGDRAVELENGGEKEVGIGDDHVDAEIRELLLRGEGSNEAETAVGEEQEESYQRTHPLTAAHRFTTSPSTLEIPSTAFVKPVTSMLANLSTVHLSDKAHSIFGGPGLPYSTSTPTRGKTMQQKPIALDAYQSQMSPIEADVYMSAIMPGIYSSVMSVLVETRKRLGTEWAEDLVRKAEAGELRILDAGGAGAGVLAVREVLRAEWERMHEDGHGDESPMALAEVDGKVGGEGASTPTGKATVLVGSKTLEKRVSKLFDNTTFVPRLPDYVHTEQQKHKGKFDLVIAPHTLWPLREDYLRKTHVQNLWSLLSNDGGVLLLLEKGVSRGFEMIAGARDMLLDNHISSPGLEKGRRSMDESTEENAPTVTKEPGMIIAPCTNHTSCPLYIPKGQVKGRRDICSFPQRYHRPLFLQNLFSTKGRNHEDVEFSYLSLMRGRDNRPVQNTQTTAIAFKGYEDLTDPADFDGRTLPRAILPPMKRQGHVILDLCTPAGQLERWTVPRSFSKQAFRDARKSSWGDLWALGAKTHVPRNVVVKDRSAEAAKKSGDRAVDLDEKRGRSGKIKFKAGRMIKTGAAAGSEDFGLEDEPGSGRAEIKGRTRGVRIKGIRDKRDKKGDGGGGQRRRRGEMEQEWP